MADDPNNNDHGAVAGLLVEVRSIREEIKLNRQRYHELNNLIGPLVLSEAMTNRHELELRDLRSLIDRMRGVWVAISCITTVLGGVVAGMLALLQHVLK